MGDHEGMEVVRSVTWQIWARGPVASSGGAFLRSALAWTCFGQPSRAALPCGLDALTANRNIATLTRCFDSASIWGPGRTVSGLITGQSLCEGSGQLLVKPIILPVTFPAYTRGGAHWSCQEDELWDTLFGEKGT
jgi:hypothetical protein